jgi:hypothetical protein
VFLFERLKLDKALFPTLVEVLSPCYASGAAIYLFDGYQLSFSAHTAQKPASSATL